MNERVPTYKPNAADVETGKFDLMMGKSDGTRAIQIRALTKWVRGLKQSDPPTCPNGGCPTKWYETEPELRILKDGVTVEFTYSCEEHGLFVVSYPL